MPARFVTNSFQGLYFLEQLRVLLASQGGISTFERPGACMHIAYGTTTGNCKRGDGDETSNSSTNVCPSDLPAFGGSAFLLIEMRNGLEDWLREWHGEVLPIGLPNPRNTKAPHCGAFV